MLDRRLVLLLLLYCGFSLGCGVEESAVPVDTGPSYSELVVTYNAELETLDRLEAKREKLIAQFTAESIRDSQGSRSQIDDLLKSAKRLQEGTSSDLPTDPDELLDSVAEHNAEATEIAEQLLGNLLGGDVDEAPATKPEPSPEDQAATAERKAAFETELATLDQELSEQKERVNRARAARDAAEQP